MIRQQPAATDAPFGIALTGGHAVNDLGAREDPARVLPAASRASQPLSQDRAGDHHAGRLGIEGAGQTAGLAGGAHQERDERGEQVRRDRQPRALRNVVDLADHLQAQPWSQNLAQDHAQVVTSALERRRDQPRGDHARLDQTEVVVAEVEQLVERRHVLAGVQIHAGQTQERLGEDAAVRLDGRARLRIAPEDAEIDRQVQDPRAFGEIHAQEEDIGPAAVRQVKPHRRALDQDRKEAVGSVTLQQAREHANRVLVGRTDAEHPPIARATADRPSHLVGQGLKRDLRVSVRQRAGHGAVQSVALGGGLKTADRRLEPPLEQVGHALVWDHARRGQVVGLLEPVAIQGVQVHGRPHPLVQVLRRQPERRQFVAGRVDLRGGPAGHEIPHRVIAERRIAASDRRDQRVRQGCHGHGRAPVDFCRISYQLSAIRHQPSGISHQPSAIRHDDDYGLRCSLRMSNSSRWVNIVSRSTPASARASWASTTPNFTPRL